MASSVDYKQATSIYDFTVQDSFGNDVNLNQFKGNVLLVVNIASQCGLTKSNYAKLTELNRKFNESGKSLSNFQFRRVSSAAQFKTNVYLGLRILSFPCNQFGSQSPENDGEDMVRNFC